MSPKHKKRARKQNDRPGTGTRPGQGGIPLGTRYVNVTTLDDDIIERIVKLTQSPLVRWAYLGVGVAALVLAAVTYLFFHADALMTVILAAFGALFVYQGTQLPKRTAKRTGAELDRAGENARKRVTFFTANEMGTVNSDGSVHTLPYSAIESVSEDDRIVALRMREDGTYMALAKAGFTYGNADDFTGAIERRVAEAGKQMSSQLRHSKRQGPGAAK